jgi:methylthioribose-1-phosphate isomerase
MRTVSWENNSLNVIDQRCLPASLKLLSLHTWHEVGQAITNMSVRGAPAIGVTAGFGLALAANELLKL